MVFCFFFQAEDGIRYLTVTGVQTCALPIFRPRPEASSRRDAPCRCRRRTARWKSARATSASRSASISRSWACLASVSSVSSMVSTVTRRLTPAKGGGPVAFSRKRRLWWRLRRIAVFDAGEDLFQQGVEYGQVFRGQCARHEVPAQRDHVVGAGIVQGLPGVGQRDPDAGPVPGGNAAVDVPGALQPVEAAGHRARGDLEGLRQLPRSVLAAVAVGQMPDDLAVAEGYPVAGGDVVHGAFVLPGDPDDPLRDGLGNRVGGGVAGEPVGEFALNRVGHLLFPQGLDTQTV